MAKERADRWRNLREEMIMPVGRPKKGKDGTVSISKSPTKKASESNLSEALKVLAGGKGFEPLFTESEWY